MKIDETDCEICKDKYKVKHSYSQKIRNVVLKMKKNAVEKKRNAFFFNLIFFSTQDKCLGFQCPVKNIH